MFDCALYGYESVYWVIAELLLDEGVIVGPL
jgi:hypothetical protein